MPIELLPNLFKIEVPLPGTPLKRLNSYFIKGQDKHLMIDTGFNHPESREAVTAALQELNVTPADCDFYITHQHADHSGGVAYLATPTSNVYCSQHDADEITRYIKGNYWELLGYQQRSYGFPPDILQETINNHPANKKGASCEVAFTTVGEGDRIEVGGYKFRVLLTPGHTLGHTCLYDKEKKLLISGDHILGDITPHITVWPLMVNSLERYLESLDKIAKFDIELTLPGHRSPITDCKKRIQELKLHHERRLAEALEIVAEGSCTAYQAAQHMTWDLTYASFEEFPFPQKWFATGETAAHLEWLVQNQAVVKEIKDEKYIFSLA
ncbi:MAG: MBL fold metallo-hydrolase [Clostridia bacterium]|jgi:glyoxylase-like metal-dependent hydrolase (beta-lactamase superfamily II)|nr:MBL fold metallo-hydrolase [Clostridia bacterium]